MLRASPSDDTSLHDGNQRKLLRLKLEWTFVQTMMAPLRYFIKKTPAEKTSVCHGKTSPFNDFYVLYHESYLSYQKLKMFSLKADLITSEENQSLQHCMCGIQQNP